MILTGQTLLVLLSVFRARKARFKSWARHIVQHIIESLGKPKIAKEKEIEALLKNSMYQFLEDTECFGRPMKRQGVSGMESLRVKRWIGKRALRLWRQWIQ